MTLWTLFMLFPENGKCLKGPLDDEQEVIRGLVAG
jgi:hypothetical protein